MTREAEYWDADTVGLLSLGRSDGTLKRGGLRGMGPIL